MNMQMENGWMMHFYMIVDLTEKMIGLTPMVLLQIGIHKMRLRFLRLWTNTLSNCFCYFFSVKVTFLRKCGEVITYSYAKNVFTIYSTGTVYHRENYGGYPMPRKFFFKKLIKLFFVFFSKKVIHLL